VHASAERAMGCAEGKKCEIRARQERNFEHGAEKKGKGWLVGWAPPSLLS
jgi:hypothetical protein